MQMSTMGEINYQAFFVSGICFLGAGAVLMAAVSPAFVSLMGMGIVFMAIGASHRGKWKKGRKK